MVDINLFKEDEEEKEWQPDSEGTESQSKPESVDDFGDDFGFDDALDGDVEPEIEEESTNNEEDLLGDDEAVPEFEDDEDEFDDVEDEDQELDYDYGETKDKKAPVWLWIVLILVVLGACFYLFVYPKLTSSVATDIPREKEIPTSQTQPVTQPDSSITGSDISLKSIESTKSKSVEDISRTQPRTTAVTQSKSNHAALLSVSQTIFENLARQNQFGAILLSENQFMIQYASETAGVSQAMGHRIKALLEVKDIKISPEDRNVKGNRVRYEGVISGNLPDKAYPIANPVMKDYANAGQFEKDIRSMLIQNKLKIQSIQKLSSSNKGTPVRIKAEGSQANMIRLMNGIKNIQGNIGLEKLFLSPSAHTDFEAENVKIVLDFLVVNN